MAFMTDGALNAALVGGLEEARECQERGKI